MRVSLARTYLPFMHIHSTRCTPIVFLVTLLFFSNGYAQISSVFNTARPKSMSQRWELDTLTSAGTFVITPYKPIYVLPLRWTSAPNGKPHSGNSSPDYIPTDNLDFNKIEAKFQLSFKVKMFQGLFWGQGDLWTAYTQKSHWQLYNNSLSRPFREINYEPEVILNFATNFDILGLKSKMLGIGFNHQSNGRETPYSRSWNRIIVQAGFETGDWQFYVRPWYRIPDEIDDNPDIQEYLGHGDITAIYYKGRNTVTLQGSSNLSFNRHLKGYAEASWSYQISGNLKGYLQITNGYGETMIDYNNRQTTFGLGISLLEWL